MQQTERRRFFRIDDSLGVSFQRISPEELAQRRKEQQERSQQGAGNALDSFESRLRTLIEASRVQTPIVAELADLLNRKMNVLISHLQIERGLLANFALQLHDVNISACGMAFRHDEAIRPGDHLLVELQLLPHDTRLHLLAESVASEADNGAYFIRLNFIDVPGDDQELLIQHIVRCQSRMLGKNRLP
jgi:hypothetical protein